MNPQAETKNLGTKTSVCGSKLTNNLDNSVNLFPNIRPTQQSINQSNISLTDHFKNLPIAYPIILWKKTINWLIFDQWSNTQQTDQIFNMIQLIKYPIWINWLNIRSTDRIHYELIKYPIDHLWKYPVNCWNKSNQILYHLIKYPINWSIIR